MPLVPVLARIERQGALVYLAVGFSAHAVLRTRPGYGYDQPMIGTNGTMTVDEDRLYNGSPERRRRDDSACDRRGVDSGNH